ncbi:MAG: response regulator [Dehalococcoidales bacterium]|nr:response regulator [Dehalococcoidales bacterium]
MPSLTAFGSTAKGLARNPLGIIALFIVLIYGFASLVVGFSDKLTSQERLIIIWFLAVFPCLVLGVFGWLVSRHHTKLYAPTDYREDESFIQASKKSYQAAISLGAATAKWAGKSVSEEDIERVTKEAAENIVRVTSPRIRQDTIQKKILWVDDRPDNNTFERQAIEAFGIQCITSTSTEDALNKLKYEKFDAIISDMGRPPDQQAGYTLLEALRSNGDHTPFLIYAGSRSPENIRETQKRGAQGTTNRPDELFEMVLGAIEMK